MKLQYSLTCYFYQCIWKISWFMAFCYITINISWNHFHSGTSFVFFFDNLRATVIHIQFKSEQTLSHPLRRALCLASIFNAFPFGSIFCSQENQVLALLHPLPSRERSTCLSKLGSLEEIPALDTMVQAEFSLYFVSNSSSGVAWAQGSRGRVSSWEAAGKVRKSLEQNPAREPLAEGTQEGWKKGSEEEADGEEVVATASKHPAAFHFHQDICQSWWCEQE